MIVDIKGVGKSEFPDGMDKEDIRRFLTSKFSPPTIQQKINDELTRNKNTVSNVNKSLAQKGGQFISDALYDNGIVSDRYGAQRIGENLSMLGEVLPVIGDATAGDEFGRAVAEGDALGAGLASLGAIPIVGDAVKKGGKIITPKLKELFPEVKFGIRESGDVIMLDKVIVEGKNKGVGTEFMKSLLGEADKQGKSVALTPSSDFGGNKKRLEKFYKRFGFVDNKGKNKDFTISESMIRPTKNTPRLSTNAGFSGDRVKELKDAGFDLEGTWFHGSDKDFDKFDFSKVGGNYDSHYGKGAYFASRFGHASEHGKVKNYKLGVKNPMTWSLQRVKEARDKGMELSDYAKSLGHDGILVGDRNTAQMVAFDNNQIKLDKTEY